MVGVTFNVPPSETNLTALRSTMTVYKISFNELNSVLNPTGTLLANFMYKAEGRGRGLSEAFSGDRLY